MEPQVGLLWRADKGLKMNGIFGLQGGIDAMTMAIPTNAGNATIPESLLNAHSRQTTNLLDDHQGKQGSADQILTLAIEDQALRGEGVKTEPHLNQDQLVDDPGREEGLWHSLAVYVHLLSQMYGT